MSLNAFRQLMRDSYIQFTVGMIILLLVRNNTTRKYIPSSRCLNDTSLEQYYYKPYDNMYR